MKYNERTTAKICDLIAKDDYTVEEVCKMVGISEAIYYRWKVEKIEFLESLKKAEEKRLEKFKKAARSGLLTLLQGKEFDEVTTEYEGKKQVSKRITKRVILPHATAVIFALKNTDPKHFRELLHQEVETNTTLTAKIDNTTTIVRKVVFRTRETTGTPQALPNAQNN